eukprot:944848_1
MWGGQKSYSFMVVHESFRDDNNRINIGDEQKQDVKDNDDQIAPQIGSECAVCFETSCYFHSDKKHDWSTALNVIKKHIIARKEYFKNVLHRDLKCVRNWSDRGEFSCTGFLLGLSKIAKELNVWIYWNFGAAQHGKGTPDAEGHVNKTAMRSGVMSHELIYNEHESHVVSAANFMTLKEMEYQSDNAKKTKSKRKIRKRNYTALTQNVPHEKSGQIVHTFAGINSLSSFLFTGQENSGYYRFLSCHCGK